MIIFEIDRKERAWVCVDVGVGASGKDPGDRMPFVGVNGQTVKSVVSAAMTIDMAIATMRPGIRAVHVSAIGYVSQGAWPRREDRERLERFMIQLGPEFPVTCVACGRKYWFTGSYSKSMGCTGKCRQIVREMERKKEAQRIEMEIAERKRAMESALIPDYSANGGLGAWVNRKITVKAGRRAPGPYQPIMEC